MLIVITAYMHTYTMYTHMTCVMLFQPESQRILQSVEREISPSYSREYSQEPSSLSPKETSINGMDQTHVQESRSSSHSPDGVGTTKTSTLRSKLEGELFQNRGKSLSHSPTHSLVDARRRTASSNQLPSESKDDPPQFMQPQNIPIAPAFTPPISRAAAKQEEKKTKVSRNELFNFIITTCTILCATHVYSYAY